MNPYVGHQNPLKEGQELLRKGLLSEAVLDLEAEVIKNPENAEGWRLLGITHAENDYDQQFEWALQHPQESAALRQAAATFKSFSGVTNKIKLANMMLALPALQSDTCETVPETYPNEVVIVSVDNLHSIIHEACHEQSEHIEEYGTRKPGKSSNLGVDMSIAGKESLRGMRFKYDVEADEDLQPLVKEKPSTIDEDYEKLGDTCTFGVYHWQPFDVICSPVRASSSVVTGLSSEETAEGTNISIIEKECWIQKQFSAFVAASGDQQSWRKGKQLTTEVAVLKDHVPSFDVTREPEVIDLLTPSPSYSVRPCTKKIRISKFSPEIIDLT